MRFVLLCLFFITICNCSQQKSEETLKQRTLSKVWIKDVLLDSTLSIRTIQRIDTNLYYAAQQGQVGIILDNGSKVFDLYQYDSVYPSFRASGFNGASLFYLSVESPALLYKIDRDEALNVYIKSNLVYKESHQKAFYDAMDFWNDQEGIAIGDPTEDCMSIIISRDGGDTWIKVSCEDLPKVKDGEAAFAASDTNIAIIGDHTWVATGGKASRILYSPDRGTTWEVYDTPIIQGTATTGMYSLDFYDENHGFAIGGDYTKPNDTLANKIRTTDGGKTWEVVANGKAPGYRSCVQYIPNRNAKELVAVGFKGVDYSNDAGETWSHLSDEGFYTLRFINDSVAYAAGKGRISKLTFRE